MLENHLITSQWCGPITGMRETTNNDNGPQGITVQSMNVSMKLRSNTHGITRSKANNEDLSSAAKNWPLRHANSKVLKGSSKSSSWIVSWSRQEVTSQRRAMMNPPSSTWNPKMRIIALTKFKIMMITYYTLLSQWWHLYVISHTHDGLKKEFFPKGMRSFVI